MAYKDLREFIDELDRTGELKHIHAPVSQDLEITEITDRVSKQEGPALLFHNVIGHKTPVLINALGSKKRMLKALGLTSYDSFFEKYFELLDKPSNMMDKLKLLPRLNEIMQMMPKSVKSGPCREVIIKDNPSLNILPAIKCWPEDGGRYITLPLVFTVDPKSGKHNCGVYRLQIFDEKTLGMHWQLHKHGAHHHLKHQGEKKRMEVAIAIGCDPALTFSAVAPLPDDIYEMLFAGLLREKAVEMVQCETIDLEVPAHSEFVLEGYVDPDESRIEGPFGDHTGYYSLEDKYPVLHLTCITHRKDPIYQTTIVGPPPQEDGYIGQAVSALFLPIIQKQFPEIVDMNMPIEGIFHNLVLVSIRKRYAGHARKIMHGIWGLGQAMFSKVIVVVDDDVDVQNVREVTWKALNHIDPERDIEFVMGPIDVLDHSSRLMGYGSHMGVDATRKWKEEGFTRPWPDEIVMSKEVKDLVTKRWKEYFE
ncbi:menaquinone biosynthesis decarboxylase [bacterium]|nr:menaquinone biosynthesis decarboxylase [bacterium]